MIRSLIVTFGCVAFVGGALACASPRIVLATVAQQETAPLPSVQGMQFTFGNIEGGEIALDDLAGQTVMVVNTASMCAFAQQFDDLQLLYDQYREAGLVVLAVPSNDFRQELDTEAEVREFCAMRFDLDLPMTVITAIRGEDAHPFYDWLAEEHGFVPDWNFNKVLIGPTGELLGTWGAPVPPLSRSITDTIEATFDL